MKPIIAIPGSELTDALPRGIHRVARRIAEQLAQSPHFECYAIVGDVAQTKDVVFRCRNLATWLQATPASAPIQPPKRKSKLKKLAKRIIPPSVVLAVANTYARTRRFVQNVRAFFQIKRPASAAPLVASSDDVFSIDDLDYLICFDPQNPLFEFDLKSPRCRVVSYLYDTVPLRINEGTFWNPRKFAGDIRRCLNSSHLLACISKCTRNDFELFFGSGDTNKMVVTHLGHDVDHYSTVIDSKEREGYLKELELSGQRYFLVLGRLEDRKNITNIIRSAEILASRTGKGAFSVVLAGDPRELGRYAELLKHVSRTVDIRVIGYVSDRVATSLLQGCEALLFVSLWEGFGIPILEAMSARTLVITSEISSMPEVAGDYAYYCDPYDPISIAAAMEKALSLTAVERNSQLTAAAEYAAQFTWSKCAEVFSDALLADWKSRKS